MQLEFIQEVLKLAGLSFVRTINFPGKYPVYEYSISSFGRLEDHPSNNKNLLVIVTPDWFSRLKMRFLSGMVYLNLEYFGESDFRIIIFNSNQVDPYNKEEFLHIFKEQIRELNLKDLCN